MRAVDVIRRKRHGKELGRDEIAFFISGCLRGTIPDYQVSAFLMAVTLAGMTEQETLALTEEMLYSGSVLDLTDLPGEKVDKHSTGGVGDKISLVVAPLVAAAGVRVPMISGRGLGHTGGTLDKLESIPGFDVELDLARFRAVVERVGCAITGQTEEIAPADRKLYALRDATATVESIPLITASILSKKLAEGINGLVLDVKVGSGAYMKDENAAMELGHSLISTAVRMGKHAVALLTSMDQPLGTHVGNGLEVRESIEVLRGGGPEDLRELSTLIAAHMLFLGKVVSDVGEGIERASNLIDSGSALERLIEMVKLQGGDPRVIDDSSRLTEASNQKAIPASQTGYVSRIDTEFIGTAGMLLGAGREEVDDRIDHAVGLIVHRKIGDPVSRGDPLVTLHFNDATQLREAERLVTNAYEIQESPPASHYLVRNFIGAEGTTS